MIDALRYFSLLVGAALLHSVWLAAVFLGGWSWWERWQPGLAARWRYRAAVVGFVWVGVAAAATAVTTHGSMFGAAVMVEGQRRLAAGPGALSSPSVPLAIEALVGTWLLGALVALSRLGLGIVRVRRLVSGAVATVRSARIVAAIAPMASNSVAVVESAAGSSPFVTGAVRPVLVLPTQIFERLSPAELRSVIRHELVHVSRRDYPVNLALRVLGAVFWFNPFLANLLGRIVDLREQRCDAESATGPGERLALARALLALDDTGLDRSAVVPRATAGALAQRIRVLVEGPPRARPLGLGGVLAMVGIAATLALAAAAAGRPSGAVIRRTMPLAHVRATDPAGTFVAVVLAGRLLEVRFEDGPGWIRQQGRRARVAGHGGADPLALEIRINGFQWEPRTER